MRSRGSSSPKSTPRRKSIERMRVVYHLFSRKIYSAIGKENIRNRRDHEFQFIKTRLLALDFILANQHHDYFETEHDKVHYFFEALGVEKNALPTKLYLGTRSPSVTSRYFVDKFPMFFPRSPARRSSTSPTLHQRPTTSPVS